MNTVLQYTGTVSTHVATRPMPFWESIVMDIAKNAFWGTHYLWGYDLQ